MSKTQRHITEVEENSFLSFNQVNSFEDEKEEEASFVLYKNQD